jgi:hypothetical protein
MESNLHTEVHTFAGRFQGLECFRDKMRRGMIAFVVILLVVVEATQAREMMKPAILILTDLG